MRKMIVIGLILLFLFGAFVFVARFLFGGDEDTWICSDGQWVKHGNPNTPMPQKNCPR